MLNPTVYSLTIFRNHSKFTSKRGFVSLPIFFWGEVFQDQHLQNPSNLEAAAKRLESCRKAWSSPAPHAPLQVGRSSLAPQRAVFRGPYLYQATRIQQLKKATDIYRLFSDQLLPFEVVKNTFSCPAKNILKICCGSSQNGIFSATKQNGSPNTNPTSFTFFLSFLVPTKPQKHETKDAPPFSAAMAGVTPMPPAKKTKCLGSCRCRRYSPVGSNKGLNSPGRSDGHKKTEGRRSFGCLISKS